MYLGIRTVILGIVCVKGVKGVKPPNCVCVGRFTNGFKFKTAKTEARSQANKQQQTKKNGCTLVMVAVAATVAMLLPLLLLLLSVGHLKCLLPLLYLLLLVPIFSCFLVSFGLSVVCIYVSLSYAIYIYIYICVCVHVCLAMRLGTHKFAIELPNIK